MYDTFICVLITGEKFFLISHTLQSLVNSVLLVSETAQVMLQRVAYFIIPLFKRLEDSRLTTNRQLFVTRRRFAETLPASLYRLDFRATTLLAANLTTG